ncbi:MAG: glycosyltransferase family 39 protein [Nitrospirae bacterium]|nr:glycosyltransferase family 39 protein [Nitrospirota bacterium]
MDRAVNKHRTITLYHQYVAGALINIVYVVILLSGGTTFYNLQMPEGKYSNNAMNGTDVMTYVVPAGNFLTYGVFGKGTVPDYHRTIGYPMFLAFFMKVFGEGWLYGVAFAQALLFATIYPVLFIINRELLGGTDKVFYQSAVFLVATGCFIVTTPIVLTDMFFSTIFSIGLCLGVMAIIRQRLIYLILHVAFMGYAAEVRPTLALYPVLNAAVLIIVARKAGLLTKSHKIRSWIAASTIALLILCNGPAIRNYINHGFFESTDIVAINLYDCLMVEVLFLEDKVDVYHAANREIAQISDVEEQIKRKKAIAFEVFLRYPFTTIGKIVIHAQTILLRIPWRETAALAGVDLSPAAYEKLSPKQTVAIGAFGMATTLLYTFFYILFVSFIVRALRGGQVLFGLTLAAITVYFLFPPFIAGGGFRMTLPVIGIIALCAFNELGRYLSPSSSSS